MIQENNRMHSWVPPVLYSALALAGVAVAIIYYWAVVPLDIIRLNNGPVPARPPQNQANNAEIFTHNICKLTDDHGTLRISFVGNNKETFLPVMSENSPKQCNDNLDYPIVVPSDLEPGKYHVHFRATYKPNPIRTIIEEWDSQEFEITE